MFRSYCSPPPSPQPTPPSPHPPPPNEIGIALVDADTERGGASVDEFGASGGVVSRVGEKEIGLTAEALIQSRKRVRRGGKPPLKIEGAAPREKRESCGEWRRWSGSGKICLRRCGRGILAARWRGEAGKKNCGGVRRFSMEAATRSAPWVVRKILWKLEQE